MKLIAIFGTTEILILILVSIVILYYLLKKLQINKEKSSKTKGVEHEKVIVKEKSLVDNLSSNENSKFCGNCGGLVSEGEVFCGTCGSKQM